MTAAYTCLVGGMPATRLGSTSLQNGTNCPGVRVVPSQVKVLVLAPDVEQMVSGSIQRSEHGSLITLDAGSISKIVGRIREMVARVGVLHPDPTILCSPDVRPHLRKMTERFLPRCAIVSANELAPSISVESIGSVTLGSEKN